MLAPLPNSDNALDVERLSLERERLKLERQKLAVEVRLKKRELADRRRKPFKDLLAKPLALAIAGGFITLMTSIVTTSYTSNENRKSEDRRAEIARNNARAGASVGAHQEVRRGPEERTPSARTFASCFGRCIALQIRRGNHPVSQGEFRMLRRPLEARSSERRASSSKRRRPSLSAAL